MASPSPPELIGQSATWLEMLERVSLLALVERPILVIGERGTGKELVAARLHYLSPRWDKPFVKVNCGAAAEDLLDSELFGHEAGAFTGATKRRQGRFERPMAAPCSSTRSPPPRRRCRRSCCVWSSTASSKGLGGEETIDVDVRLVAATNVDLPGRAADGRFRADLLDRLAFDVITLPPLRARPEDIILLAEHFGSASPANWKAISPAGRATRWRRCAHTPGPAMCANCATPPSAPPFAPWPRKPMARRLAPSASRRIFSTRSTRPGGRRATSSRRPR